MHDLTNTHARRLVLLAQEEAIRLGHDQIGTEHLLLGLLHRQTGAGRSVLASLGVTPQRVHDAVDEVIGRGPAKPPAIRGRAARTQLLPFTLRAEWILRRATLEAKATEHNDVAPEHILLALLREDGGEAAKVLDHLALDRDEARRRLLVTLRVLPYPGPSVLDGIAGDLDTRIAALQAAKDEAIDNRDFSLAVELRQTERALISEQGGKVGSPRTA
jgi:ATP-dependent Clp protease ATP-binding subunit ClpA